MEPNKFFGVAAKAVIDACDILSDADRKIGDGDHGIGMRRGFESALEKLEENQSVSFAEASKTVGSAIMSSSGGASGAIFGTMFRSGAKALENGLDGETFACFLETALESVMKLGKVSEGQKTMVDALAPAARAARGSASEGLEAALGAAAQASNDGVEATRSMVAMTGKARALGERSLGHPDPGAITISIILKAMSESA